MSSPGLSISRFRSFAEVLALSLLAGARPALAGGSDCSPTPFVHASVYVAGDEVDQAATGDFNGDGIPDVLAIGNVISVLPGIGDGTFGPPIVTQIGTSFPFVVADFNGDGKLDLVLSGESDEAIHVLLGKGDGTFQEKATYATGYATNLAVGDFDGDGKLDLAETTSLFGASLWILKGNGNGTFQTPVSYSSPTPTTLLVADFNGDGRDDLAGPSQNEILIALSNPDGSPGTTMHLPVGSQMLGAIATDLDGDGKIDFVVSRNENFEFFRGIGDGTFQASIQYPAKDDTNFFLAVDVNGDGLLDLAGLRAVGSFGRSASAIDVWRQLPGGGFASPVGYQAPFGIGALATADFDGDGRPDFAAPGASDEKVAVFLSRAGGLRSARSIHFGDAPTAFARADFDGDGYDELVVIGRYGGFWVVGRDGEGNPAVVSTTDLSGAGVSQAVTGDLNGDGRIDLVLGSFSAIYVLLGRGDGSFEDPVSYTAPAGVNSLAAADFDGDGRLDIVFATEGSTPDNLQIWPGKGDGTFLPAIIGPPHAPLRRVAAGDVNGDGFPDVVATESNCCVGTPQTISVFFGNGDGTLREPVHFLTGAGPTTVAIADADGDGVLDISTADSQAATVTRLSGDGHGGFAEPESVGVGWSPMDLIVQDLDGDSRNDLATANSGSSNGQDNSVSFLLGRAGGAFDPPIRLPTGSPPAAVIAGNFLGGPALDLAAANPDDGSVTFFEGAKLGASVRATSAVVGDDVALDARASGWGDVAYQWRKNATALTDGGRVTGAKTGELKIERAQFGDAGSYDVVVTDSCGTATSNVALLAVEFADVAPTDQFHAAILKVARAGITGGCGGGNYCPDSATTRAEMAVFLLRGEHGGTYQPAPATGTVFGDVSASTPFAKWIEQVAAEGITQGCGSGNYCPAGPVTRGEMAVFLLRAKHGGSYHPPAATGTVFGDVSTSTAFAKWIERAAAEGIASGCGGGDYCPDETVTRGQMAAFLSRTFSLP